MTSHRSMLVVGAVVATLAAATLLFAVDPAEVPVLPEDLDTFSHVNTLVVPDSESPIHGVHHFYANDRARRAFESGGSDEYPDEAIFVGKVYKPVKTDDGRYKEGDLVAYTLMEKDAVDVSAEATGDWHFVMYDAEGTNKNVDPAKNCFGCHEPSPETDFVLSTPLG